MKASLFIIYTFAEDEPFGGGQFSWMPPSVLAEAWVKFCLCWKGLVNTACCCCVTKFWASASRGHKWVGWSSAHRLHGYLAFLFSVVPSPALSFGFLSP